MARGYYVTGTDTGVGKTLASACLLQLLRARGLRCAGMKPVASGCTRGPGDAWTNEDALALQAASSEPLPDYAQVNPYALPEPTAPQLAADRAGIAVELPAILAAYGRLAAERDAVVVEGVGGWLAPLSHGLDQSALVHALQLPVVLVVGVRLGCLNHARLTERALAADGVAVLGWIGSVVDPGFADSEQYGRLLDDALAMPRLGWLPHAHDGRTEPLLASLQAFPAV
jgi:dethiobiotin synthetase